MSLVARENLPMYYKELCNINYHVEYLLELDYHLGRMVLLLLNKEEL